MKGRCNCNKKSTSEYLVYGKDYVSTIKFCKDCEPKLKYNELVKIYGK